MERSWPFPMESRQGAFTATAKGPANSDRILSEALDRCATSPEKRDILAVKEASLAALADRTTLRTVNQSLVEKAATWRKKPSKKHFGEARVLTIKELRAKAQEREEKESVAEHAKAGKAALQS